jgi:hypothetical protein
MARDPAWVAESPTVAATIRRGPAIFAVGPGRSLLSIGARLCLRGRGFRPAEEAVPITSWG